MKLFLVDAISVASDGEKADRAFHRECSALIADLILSHISEDPALFGMRHVGEGTASPIEPDARFGDVETVRIADRQTLRKVLQECGDPYSGKWMLIRSLVSCRAVFFGSDGQAFVCLPANAPSIISPDSSRITVDECSHLLAQTDYLDGPGPFTDG
jgi:hypothetical protein